MTAIPPTTRHYYDLNPLAQSAVGKLSAEELAMFDSAFDNRKRSTALMLILAIFLPIQLFFLDKVGLGIAFLLTGGGFGIWYVIEWFLTPGRVREYNGTQALRTIQEIQIARDA